MKEHTPSRYFPPICPRCGSNSGFHRVEVGDENTGCLMLLFGGILAWLIYDSSRHDKIECEECSYIFRPIRRITKWDVLFVVVLVLSILFLVLYLLLGHAP